jgi:hypothetical protein
MINTRLEINQEHQFVYFVSLEHMKIKRKFVSVAIQVVQNVLVQPQSSA